MASAGDVLIFDAVRSPRGKARAEGSLSAIRPPELIKQLVDALSDRNGPAAKTADHMVLGCVGQVGAQGGHIAHVAKLHAGLPTDCTAWSLNNFCTSGLSAITAAADRVAGGAADLALAGGVESMSQVPFLADRGSYYADPAFSAALHYIPVALSADVLASREGVGRPELDAVTLVSHQRAGAAQRDGLAQQSLVPVRAESGQIALARDEYVRGDTAPEGLARFGPAFAELGASYAAVLKDALGIAPPPPVHAVVHAPGVADGAGLALVGSRAAGTARGLTPRARIVAHAEAAGDPVLGLTAGRAAMARALKRAGMTLADIDVIEYMEAFAVVPALFLRDHPDAAAKTNIFGGHIARGHALGATGAVLVSALLDALEQKDLRIGLVVTFAASGIGSAMIAAREP